LQQFGDALRVHGISDCRLLRIVDSVFAI
jgi:hypothetical protein